MCLLCAFGLGVVLTRFGVFLAIERSYLLFGHIYSQRRQVDGVGTHVGDKSRLVELLCHLHGARNGETELAAGLLLQRGGGERRCGGAFGGFLLGGIDGEGGSDAVVEELLGFGLGVELARELGGEVFFVVGQVKNGNYLVMRGFLEVLNLLLAFHYQPYGHRLHTSCGERRFDFAPQDGRNFVTHKTVEHTASLLGVDEVHVDVARIFDGVKYGGFGYLVENYAFGVFVLEFQRLVQMPCYGLPLTVFIGCQPHGVGLGDRCFQLRHKFLFVVRNFVQRLETVGDVDAHLVFHQVAHVPETRFHCIIAT